MFGVPACHLHNCWNSHFWIATLLLLEQRLRHYGPRWALVYFWFALCTLPNLQSLLSAYCSWRHCSGWFDWEWGGKHLGLGLNSHRTYSTSLQNRKRIPILILCGNLNSYNWGHGPKIHVPLCHKWCCLGHTYILPSGNWRNQLTYSSWSSL